MMFPWITTVLSLSLLLLDGVSSSSSILKKSKSLWKFQNNGIFDKATERRRLQVSTPHLPSFQGKRQLTFQGDQEACDASFLTCLDSDKCVDCFVSLQTGGINWASVAAGTPCVDVVSFLSEGGHCVELKDDSQATTVFCGTFDACVVWDGDMEFDDDDYIGVDDDIIDSDIADLVCSELTECDWPGIHESFLGDGICHNNIYGCYNTAVCGFDGGDCCEDTCDGDHGYMDCGHDGYACRDPQSKSCDPSLTLKCNAATNNADSVKCEPDETKYRLVMYDSFGDGWDTTTLKLTSQNTKRTIFNGSLKDGSMGTEYVCISKNSACYDVDVSGGTWGVEVSWEFKPLGEGSPSIAGGGAPMDCQFGVAGAVCDNTCGGKPNVDPNSDPNYKQLKELSECIEEKCLIQLGACTKDLVCEGCFNDDAPDYCFSVDTFNALVDCTMCSCTDRSETSTYCSEKAGPGSSNSGTPPKKDEDSFRPVPCTPGETIKGSNAVIAFSNCTNLDQIGMMVTKFDNNNFGELDAFELCAHSFQDQSNHGGHTALGCMQILMNAIVNPTGGRADSDAPVEAIAALADNLYHHAASFCNCAKEASEDCPLCPSFMSFKTLLYEALDACQALDEIDCDAWNEFSTPCRNNLFNDFGVVNFGDSAQCDYVKRGCGGAGSFPAFRRIDCGKEIPATAWSLYTDFASRCLQGDNGIAPAPIQPAPTPVAPVPVAPTAPVPIPTPIIPSDNNKPYDTGGSPTPKPYVPADGPAKPYVPSDSKGSTGGKKKKRHFFRNFFLLCLIVGGGYFYYKRQSDSFNFVRYRRARTFDFGGAGESEMYSGLNNSTTFEPPSLPPPPAAMDSTGSNGMGFMAPMNTMGPMGGPTGPGMT